MKSRKKKGQQKKKSKEKNQLNDRMKIEKDIARVGQRWTIAELLTRMFFFFFSFILFLTETRYNANALVKIRKGNLHEIVRDIMEMEIKIC